MSGRIENAPNPQFTHFRSTISRLIPRHLAGGNRSTVIACFAYCLFTDPPLARVGLSEGGAGPTDRRAVARLCLMSMCAHRREPINRAS